MMPVLTARGAGVRHRRHWLFRDLDVTVDPGELVALVGPPGSGRTTLLLALAGRFRLTAGTVDIAGTAALGHVPEVTSPESVFTVTEHVRERLALLGRSRAEAAAVDLRGLEPGRRGRDLTPYEKQVLGVVLAGLSGSEVIALDGFDDGLDSAEQAALLALLTGMAADGVAILLTAREIDPARVSTVVRLTGEDRPPADPKPDPEPKPESAPDPDPEPKPESAPDPESKPDPDPDPDPEPESGAEPDEADLADSGGKDGEKS
jgi:ABC-2 type transport system ATP-binding protein